MFILCSWSTSSYDRNPKSSYASSVHSDTFLSGYSSGITTLFWQAFITGVQEGIDGGGGSGGDVWSTGEIDIQHVETGSLRLDLSLSRSLRLTGLCLVFFCLKAMLHIITLCRIPIHNHTNNTHTTQHNTHTHTTHKQHTHTQHNTQTTHTQHNTHTHTHTQHTNNTHTNNTHTNNTQHTTHNTHTHTTHKQHTHRTHTQHTNNAHTHNTQTTHKQHTHTHNTHNTHNTHTHNTHNTHTNTHTHTQ